MRNGGTAAQKKIELVTGVGPLIAALLAPPSLG